MNRLNIPVIVTNNFKFEKKKKTRTWERPVIWASGPRFLHGAKNFVFPEMQLLYDFVLILVWGVLSVSLSNIGSSKENGYKLLFSSLVFYLVDWLLCDF